VCGTAARNASTCRRILDWLLGTMNMSAPHQMTTVERIDRIEPKQAKSSGSLNNLKLVVLVVLYDIREKEGLSISSGE
jgi:hypothetical protein